MNGNQNMYAVYEAKVRMFDSQTMIATCVIPGVYGMEPIECPPFTRRGMSPSEMAPLQVGDRVLVVQGENEVPEWLAANPDRYIASWNTSWGIVATFPKLGADVNLTTPAALCGSISFTFQSGRRYRLVCYVRAFSPTTPGTISIDLKDGSTSLLSLYGGQSHSYAAGNYGDINAEYIIDGTGQTHSQLHFFGAFIGIAHVLGNSAFYIEDVGPVTRLPGDMPSPDDFGWGAYDARFVNTTGDVMTGPLSMQPNSDQPIALYKYAAGNWSYMGFWDEDKLTRRGYFGIAPDDNLVLASDTGDVAIISYGGAGKAVTINANEIKLQYANRITLSGNDLYFNSQIGTSYLIDTSGHSWWTGTSNGDAMHFNRSIQRLSIRAGSDGEGLRLSSSTPYISFYNAAASARHGYFQMTSTGINIAHDGGAVLLQTGTNIWNFCVAGGVILVINPSGIGVNGQVSANGSSSNQQWDQANMRVYCSDGAANARISLFSGSVGPQLRASQAGGERVDVVNYNCSAFAPIGASAFPVGSSITTKRDVRSIPPRPLRIGRDRKPVHHDPLADTVPEPDIMALRPVAFRPKVLPMVIARADPDVEVDPNDPETWRATERDPTTPLGIEGRRERLGLIAEEVQTVLPSAVSIDEDGAAIGIDYAQVTVALLDHVQRLTDQVATLQYRIIDLEGSAP